MKTSNSITIPLEEFPKPCPKGNAHIALYLESLLVKTLSETVERVELPSLPLLAEFFDCPLMQLYDAFRALRVYGYDYQFLNLDDSVQIWSKKQ